MTMPMFHVGGTGLVNCMTFRAGSLVVVPGFDTESFWPLVRRTEATVVFLLGAMASFLWKRPPGPGIAITGYSSPSWCRWSTTCRGSRPASVSTCAPYST